LNLEVDIGAELQFASSHTTTWHETGEEKGRKNYGLKKYLRYQSNLAAMSGDRMASMAGFKARR